MSGKKPEHRTLYPAHYWLIQKEFDGIAPPFLVTRGIRWPNTQVVRQSLTCLLVNAHIGRGIRPAGNILVKAKFDVPILCHAIVTEGVYAGNEVIFYLPDSLHPEGTEWNPSPEDFKGWTIQIEGTPRRHKGFFYKAYVNNGTITRLDSMTEEGDLTDDWEF